MRIGLFDGSEMCSFSLKQKKTTGTFKRRVLLTYLHTHKATCVSFYKLAHTHTYTQHSTHTERKNAGSCLLISVSSVLSINRQQSETKPMVQEVEYIKYTGSGRRYASSAVQVKALAAFQSTHSCMRCTDVHVRMPTVCSRGE